MALVRNRKKGSILSNAGTKEFDGLDPASLDASRGQVVFVKSIVVQFRVVCTEDCGIVPC